MKTWIVGADFRRCGDFGCVGYDKKNARVVVHPDGRIDIECRDCGKRRTEQARRWKENRPCIDCGHVRSVTVALYFGGKEEHWERRCDACKLEQSAAVHMSTARRLLAKAQKIKAKRVSAAPPSLS